MQLGIIIWWRECAIFPHQTFNSSRVCTNALLQIHSSDFKKFMLYYDNLANMKTHHGGFSPFFHVLLSKWIKKKLGFFHIPKIWQILILCFARSLQSSIILLFLKSGMVLHTQCILNFLKFFSQLCSTLKKKFLQHLEMNFLSGVRQKKKRNLFVIYQL